MMSRRGFLETAAVIAGASAVSGRAQAASIPEAPRTKDQPDPQATGTLTTPAPSP